MTYEAVAPARVDLAGGTLDIWPVHLMLEEPVTVNLAVALRMRARVRRIAGRGLVLRSVDHGTEERFPDLDTARRNAQHRLAVETIRALHPDGGLEVETDSPLPPGSGLGGSSALAVALSAAIARCTGRRLPRSELAAFASDVEGRVLGKPPGSQDHLAAVHGGLAAWHWGPGRPTREDPGTDPQELSDHLVLAWSGVPHSSGDNNWRVVRAFLDGDPAVRRGFRSVAAAALEVRNALRSGDLEAVAAGMARDSRARRRLFPGFHNERTRSLEGTARRAGAWGGRPCGAGGGGCLVFVVPDGRRDAVEAALIRRGARILPVAPDRRGVRLRRRPA